MVESAIQVDTRERRLGHKMEKWSPDNLSKGMTAFDYEIEFDPEKS